MRAASLATTSEVFGWPLEIAPFADDPSDVDAAAANVVGVESVAAAVAEFAAAVDSLSGTESAAGDCVDFAVSQHRLRSRIEHASVERATVVRIAAASVVPPVDFRFSCASHSRTCRGIPCSSCRSSSSQSFRLPVCLAPAS